MGGRLAEWCTRSGHARPCYAPAVVCWRARAQPPPRPGPPLQAYYTDCDLAYQLWADGYEIADHTVSHAAVRPLRLGATCRHICQGPLPWQTWLQGLPCGFVLARAHRTLAPCIPLPPPLPQLSHSTDKDEVVKEILGARSRLADECGIPSEDIRGFRCRRMHSACCAGSLEAMLCPKQPAIAALVEPPRGWPVCNPSPSARRRMRAGTPT